MPRFFDEGGNLVKLLLPNELIFRKFKDSYFCKVFHRIIFFRSPAICKLFSLFPVSLVGGKSGMCLYVRGLCMVANGGNMKMLGILEQQSFKLPQWLFNVEMFIFTTVCPICYIACCAVVFLFSSVNNFVINYHLVYYIYHRIKRIKRILVFRKRKTSVKPA